MVRLIHKTKIASAVTLAVAAPVAVANIIAPAYADNPQNVDFNVNVTEVLTVSITDPASWASGELSNKVGDRYVSDLLRNKVNVSASTNNPVGVTVSMYTNNTNLVNQANNTITIPTLASTTTAGNFPTNYWGYSLNDNGSNTEANYGALTTSASPIRVFTTVGTASTSSGSQDIYFGAKADDTKDSGTYEQTVYFAAVTGTITEDNPEVPVNPAPATPDPIDNNPSYDSTVGSTNGTTTYTTRTTSGTGTSSTSGKTKTTTTEVSSGNTTSSYAAAQGVTTKSGIDGGSSVAIALGVASAVAATSGIFFFVAAKRRKDDDDEE